MNWLILAENTRNPESTLINDAEKIFRWGKSWATTRLVVCWFAILKGLRQKRVTGYLNILLLTWTAYSSEYLQNLIWLYM